MLAKPRWLNESTAYTLSPSSKTSQKFPSISPPGVGLFFRDTVVFRMTCGNSVNKGANIHSVVKTVDIKNMPLNMIKKSFNIRVVQPCRFPNRQTSQEWSIYLFRPSQYAPKYRDSPEKKYPKLSRYLLILQSRVPP